MTGTLQYLDESGHVETTWDTECAAAVAEAEAIFRQKVNVEKQLAYAIPAAGAPAEVVRAFNPHLERIVLTPQMQGGAS